MSIFYLSKTTPPWRIREGGCNPELPVCGLAPAGHGGVQAWSLLGTLKFTASAFSHDNELMPTYRPYKTLRSSSSESVATKCGPSMP